MKALSRFAKYPPMGGALKIDREDSAGGDGWKSASKVELSRFKSLRYPRLSRRCAILVGWCWATAKCLKSLPQIEGRR